MLSDNRYALIISCNKYNDPDFPKLKSPVNDAIKLSQLLKNSKIGSFKKVDKLINKQAAVVQQEIEQFFSNRESNDFLLLYLSCHGIKDINGHLYYAASDTQRKLLRSTGISANFVNEIMGGSDSRRQLLLLDCCYSGAFARGMNIKSGKTDVHTRDFFDGDGKVILTSSDSTQYSFEGDILTRANPSSAGDSSEFSSLFTQLLIEGLKTGNADKDNNGYIDYQELYTYIKENMRRYPNRQNPKLWTFNVDGRLFIGRNRNYSAVYITESPSEEKQVLEGIKIIPSISKIYIKDHGNPLSICFGRKNPSVFYCTTGANEIIKFNSDGKELSSWGNQGQGRGEMDGAYGVAVDSNDNVYITEMNNNRVQKFDTNGNFVKMWGESESEEDDDDDDDDEVTMMGRIRSWSKRIRKRTTFDSPFGITVDHNDNVYVTDVTERIQKFDSKGSLLTKWGGQRLSLGKSRTPSSLAVDYNNNVYVSDIENNRIQKFDSKGNFIDTWGQKGKAEGSFEQLWTISIPRGNHIYTVDSIIQRFPNKKNGIQTDRIQLFDLDGTFKKVWYINKYKIREEVGMLIQVNPIENRAYVNYYDAIYVYDLF